MRVNFWVALVLCLLGLFWFVAIQRGWWGLGGPMDQAAPAPARAAARPKAPPPPPRRRTGSRR
jgi:hypothetical protein